MEEDIRQWFEDIEYALIETMKQVQKLKMEIVGRDEKYKHNEYLEHFWQEWIE